MLADPYRYTTRIDLLTLMACSHGMISIGTTLLRAPFTRGFIRDLKATDCRNIVQEQEIRISSVLPKILREVLFEVTKATGRHWECNPNAGYLYLLSHQHINVTPAVCDSFDMSVADMHPPTLH